MKVHQVQLTSRAAAVVVGTLLAACAVGNVAAEAPGPVTSVSVLVVDNAASARLSLAPAVTGAPVTPQQGGELLLLAVAEEDGVRKELAVTVLRHDEKATRALRMAVDAVTTGGDLPSGERPNDVLSRKIRTLSQTRSDHRGAARALFWAVR